MQINMAIQTRWSKRKSGMSCESRATWDRIPAWSHSNKQWLYWEVEFECYLSDPTHCINGRLERTGQAKFLVILLLPPTFLWYNLLFSDRAHRLQAYAPGLSLWGFVPDNWPLEQRPSQYILLPVATEHQLDSIFRWWSIRAKASQVNGVHEAVNPMITASHAF